MQFIEKKKEKKKTGWEGQGFFCVLTLHILPVSVWVLSEYLGFHSKSKDMHLGKPGHSELTLCANESVNGCLLFVCWLCNELALVPLQGKKQEKVYKGIDSKTLGQFFHNEDKFCLNYFF